MSDEQLDRLRKFFDEENKRIEAMKGDSAGAFEVFFGPVIDPHKPWTLAEITEYRSLLPKDELEAAWSMSDPDLETPGGGLCITADAVHLVDRELAFHLHCTQRKDG